VDDYTTSRVDELPEIWDGFGRLVRKGLGITAFGVNVMDVPADYTTRDHTEADSGQEELYTALAGGGTLLVGPEDGEAELAVTPETVTRVAPGARRRFRSGPLGCRLLIVGGTPGAAYAPQEWSS
jgi:hypothetical protein